jgi:hypothetical protein
MSSRRRIGVSVSLLGMTLAVVLAGCGGGGSMETAPTGEVKIVPPLNPKGENTGAVSDEYKSLSAAGKASKK